MSEKDKEINRQLYKNSPLQKLFEETDAEFGGGKPLFNAKDPNLAILHEKPEHRALLWMKAQGASNREISSVSGYTEPWLSQLFRQPWAQAMLVEILREGGADEVRGLIKSAAADSVLTLINIRDEPKAPYAVRRACAVDLVEQFLGKPKQHVEMAETQASKDVEELDKQIEQLQMEENRLLGRGNAAAAGNTLPHNYSPKGDSHG